MGGYYRAIELTGFFLPVLFGSLALFLPGDFAWFGPHLDGVVEATFAVAAVTGAAFIFYRISKKIWLFNVSRYAYVLFFAYIIYVTGGMNSPLLFTLIFPVVTSAVYLNRISTRNTAVTVASFLIVLSLWAPEGLSPVQATERALELILLASLIFYIYKMVVETLRQKYEKEEAARRLVEMTEMDRLKDDFLSVAQHQLRTPLSGIKWTFEALKAGGRLPLEDQSFVDAGLDRVKDSLDIVNKMLETAAPAGGPPALKRRLTDLSGLLRTVAAELNFMVVKKGVKLSLSVPDSLLISADGDKLKAALGNIVDNAVKYSPEGRVRITLEDGESSVRITVTDTGIGVAPDDLPFIFERLRRGRNAVALEPDESGVGLYTAKKVIELHDGSVSVKSELGKGTTVTVILPK